MSSRTPSRARILDAGVDLLSQRGLSGVTIGVLAGEAGLSKSGMFAHFRSKEAVEIALLDHMAELADRAVVRPAMAAPPGLPRLVALVARWLGWPARAGLAGGCPIAAALFELDDLDNEVRAHVLALEQSWRGLLVQTCRGAVAEGHLGRDLDVDQFVWELCGIYLSHHASARFLKDPRSDERAIAAFTALLRRAGASAERCAELIDDARTREDRS
jgi:AcrR family transcriptional regulator